MEQSQQGDIMVEVDGQRVAGYLAQPAAGDGPGVLVLHAWWGLNAFFKELCDRLAGEGFTAFAPDMNDGKVAATIQEAEKLTESRDFDQNVVTAKAAFDWLRSRLAGGPHADAGLGLVGFSMGAEAALILASSEGDAARAVVIYYGAAEVEYRKIRASVQGHFGEQDEWTEMQWADMMEQALLGAGVPVEFHRYPNTGHWFIENDRPDAYLPEVATLAWERTVRFLKDHLY